MSKSQTPRNANSLNSTFGSLSARLIERHPLITSSTRMTSLITSHTQMTSLIASYGGRFSRSVFMPTVIYEEVKLDWITNFRTQFQIIIRI